MLLDRILRSANDSAIRISSGAVVLLGLVVMIAWHFGAAVVVQLHPAFAPMQYNTALCFVLSGLAALYAHSRPAVAGASAIVVAVISFASLLQYALGVSFGIDELLMRGYITVRTSHPGRMSPHTAIGFMLAGSAMATLTLWRASPRRAVVAQILASLVGGWGLAAVISYSAGLEPEQSASQFTRMALHTATGFVVLAFAVLLNAWRAQARRAQQLLAIPAGVAALAVALSLFLALSEWEIERVDQATALNVDRAATVLEERLRGYVQNVGVLADAWGRTGGEPQPSWEADVARFLRDEQVFLAISRGRPDGKLDWIFPVDPYPDYIGFDYSTNARRSEGLALARQRGGAWLTGPLALKSGRPGVLIIAPLLPARGDAPPFVVVAALLEDLFRPTILAMPSYRIEVFEGEQIIYGSEAESDVRTTSSREVRIDGASLRLAATPLPQTLAALRSPLPMVVLVSGLLGSLLLAATAHLAQVASRRSAALAAANEKLERLALFDELTGLGNRNLLLIDLDEALDVARREFSPLPLLFLDLNGFKAINDTFGHEAGDDVLREFAARLVEAIPASAEAFRTGGDEFAVLAKPGTSLDEAHAIAREIARVTRAPMLVVGQERSISVSIGIAAFPRHGEERARLLRAADVAMYQAKHTAAEIQVATDEAPTVVLRALKQAPTSR